MNLKLRLLSVSCFVFLPFQNVFSAVEDHKNVCEEGEKLVVDTAVKTAQSEVLQAIGLLDAGDEVTLAKFKRWFGEPTKEAQKEIKNTLSAIHLFSGFQNSWCVREMSKPVPDEFNWAPGDLAGVHPSSTSDMFFVSDYFKLESTGVDSKSSTITHENAHQVGANYTPEVYGVGDMENLAKANPAFARSHAQSIEYFVTDLLYGV